MFIMVDRVCCFCLYDMKFDVLRVLLLGNKSGAARGWLGCPERGAAFFFFPIWEMNCWPSCVRDPIEIYSSHCTAGQSRHLSIVVLCPAPSRHRHPRAIDIKRPRQQIPSAAAAHHFRPIVTHRGSLARRFFLLIFSATD